MKLHKGDKVNYHYPENSFPASKNNGKDYTGVVTDVRKEATHDRASVDIDTNDEHLHSVECNQEFITKATSWEKQVSAYWHKHGDFFNCNYI